MFDTSDTPAGAIARLDNAIRRRGEDVTLHRIGTPDITHGLRAHVRGYQPRDLAGGITIGASKVILSPTGLAGSVFAAALPQPGDKITIAGRKRNILGAEPIYEGDNVLVRIVMTVAG